MSELPDVTFCVCTYKRPYYGTLTLSMLLNKVGYAGKKKFLVSDGGSDEEDLRAYDQILKGTDHKIAITDNLSDMLNVCARESGEVWFVTLDDFMPNVRFDITPDVRFLMENPDVGMIRMGRLAYWEAYPDEQKVAYLRGLGGLHWWVFDKARTTHPYICSINTSLYHRRFWNDYGDIPPCRPHMPGDAEIIAAERYNRQQGVTVAVPMRFGQDCQDWQEPIWHFGTWRSDDYASAREQGHFG